MIPLLSNFLADPLYYIGYLFAFGGTVGFLLFLRGFFTGISHVIKQDGHAEHMDHYRTRAVWGVLIMAYFLGLWEILRWIFSWFGAGSVNGIAIFVAVCEIIFLVWQMYPSKKAGH